MRARSSSSAPPTNVEDRATLADSAAIRPAPSLFASSLCGSDPVTATGPFRSAQSTFGGYVGTQGE